MAQQLAISKALTGDVNTSIPVLAKLSSGVWQLLREARALFNSLPSNAPLTPLLIDYLDLQVCLFLIPSSNSPLTLFFIPRLRSIKPLL